MSTSPAIIERNRANAQHSTGPKTPAGKSHVSQNARRYGLFISDATLEHEEAQDHAELFAGYVELYCPWNMVEEEMVRQLAMATLRLRRLDRMENAALFSTDNAHTRHEASVIIQQKYQSASGFMERIERARTLAERSFSRAYTWLEARKARRVTQRVPPANLEVAEDSRHEPLPQNKPSFYGRQQPKPAVIDRT